MSLTVERTRLDLRYQTYRLRNDAREARLLASIAERGIEQPLAGQKTKLVASLLYLRYSKRRYLKFYRVFNRFAMKCFLHEALMYWGYAASQCIIDNTNLARLRGAGKLAIIVPEMSTFSRHYGFQFRCHELQHSNRKAGSARATRDRKNSDCVRWEWKWPIIWTSRWRLRVCSDIGSRANS